MQKKKRGRPVGATGPLIACGWCKQQMTTTELCKHLAHCPDRPVTTTPPAERVLDYTEGQ